MTSVAATSPVRPTRVRYVVVLMMVLLAMVTYLDRACIAALSPAIMRDLSLSKVQMGWVFSAFALAYALFEIPTAQWADMRGTRFVFTRIVLWWTAFTAATACATGFLSLFVIRFLFGAGEAGAWPCMARTFSKWIPLKSRGRAQGVFFAGAHLAGGAAPMVALALVPFVGWRAVFLITCIPGLVWALVWLRWYRDNPSEHPGVNQAEIQLIEQGRVPPPRPQETSHWALLLRSPNTALICLMSIPNTVAFYFCITWLPVFLKEKHGFEATSLGIFSGLPLTLSVAADLLGGTATDALVRKMGLRFGRCAIGITGNVAAGAAMLAAATTGNPVAAAVLISLAVASTMFTLGASWGTCLDVAGSRAGLVAASMNTSSQLGSILSPPIVVYLAQHFHDWNAPIFAISALFAGAALCWCFIDPTRPTFE